MALYIITEIDKYLCNPNVFFIIFYRYAYAKPVIVRGLTDNTVRVMVILYIRCLLLQVLIFFHF